MEGMLNSYIALSTLCAEFDTIVSEMEIIHSDLT